MYIHTHTHLSLSISLSLHIYSCTLNHAECDWTRSCYTRNLIQSRTETKMAKNILKLTTTHSCSTRMFHYKAVKLYKNLNVSAGWNVPTRVNIGWNMRTLIHTFGLWPFSTASQDDYCLLALPCSGRRSTSKWLGNRNFERKSRQCVCLKTWQSVQVIFSPDFLGTICKPILKWYF